MKILIFSFRYTVIATDLITNNKVPPQGVHIMLTNLYCKVCTYLTTFKNDERGVTAIEYGLIAAAMAGVLITAFYTTGDNITVTLGNAFTTIKDALATAYKTP